MFVETGNQCQRQVGSPGGDGQEPRRKHPGCRHGPDGEWLLQGLDDPVTGREDSLEQAQYSGNLRRKVRKWTWRNTRKSSDGKSKGRVSRRKLSPSTPTE